MISKNYKIIISILSGCIWIYFRDNLCYKSLPRNNIFIALFVGLWIYLNYLDPLFLPLGLLILYLFSFNFR